MRDRASKRVPGPKKRVRSLPPKALAAIKKAQRDREDSREDFVDGGSLMRDQGVGWVLKMPKLSNRYFETREGAMAYRERRERKEKNGKRPMGTR